MYGKGAEEPLGRKRMKFSGLCTATVVQGEVHKVSPEHRGTAEKNQTQKPFWNKGFLHSFCLGKSMQRIYRGCSHLCAEIG